MSQNWYYAVGDDKIGPVSSRDLKCLAKEGVIGPDDLVWREGQPDWRPASNIKGMEFSASPETPSTPEMSPAAPPPPPSVSPFTPVSTAVPGPVNAGVAAGPVGPQTVAAPATASRGNSTVLILSVVLGVVLLGGTAVGAWLLGQSGNGGGSNPDSPTAVANGGDDDPKDKVDSRTDKLHDELERERDALRKEIKKLNEQKDGLDSDTRRLQKEKQDLQKDIDQLTAKLEFINQYQDADFVMINPTHFTVAVTDDGGFTVISKAEGELAAETLAASRIWHIPRIGHDPALTREIFSHTEPGDPIPPELAARITDLYWREHTYVPFESDELIVFRDLSTYEFRVGYLKAADSNGFEFFPLGQRVEEVSWSDVQSGSARRGPFSDVLDSLSDADFLEYCILRVAQKLGTAGPAPRPSVMVHVEIDISRDHLDFYESLDRQIEEQGRPPASFEASGALGILAFLTDLAVRTSAPSRRLAMRQQMIDTDPLSRARHLSRYVEDEIVARLSRCGLSPITEKDMSLIVSSGLDDVRSGATLHDATHLLLVTVKDPKGTGDYHLSVRLYHEDGKELWSGAGDRVLDTQGVGNQFHVASGRPAMVYLKADSFETFTGQESPPILSLTRNRSGAQRYSHLVYLESSPNESQILHRPLYQKDLFSTPQDQFDKVEPIETIKDVPEEFLLRYAVNTIASSMLPSAGRVIRVDGTTGSVALGQKHGVKAGDRLRVIRVRREEKSQPGATLATQSAFGLLAAGDSLLPTEVVVTEAAAGQSTVSISPTGLESEWPENAALTIDDLVITKAVGTRVVVVEPLKMPFPSQKLMTGLGIISNPKTKTFFASKVIEKHKEVLASLENGLRQVGLRVLRGSEQKGAIAPKATHRVYGEIVLSDNMNTSAKSSARPIYRVKLRLAPAGSPETLGQFEFDLHEITEGRRKP